MSTNKNDYYHLGLTDDEVLQSREKNGINLLTPPKRPSLWKLYLEKFEDPVVRVLLVAAAILINYLHHRKRICRNNRNHSRYLIGYRYRFLFRIRCQ